MRFLMYWSVAIIAVVLASPASAARLIAARLETALSSPQPKSPNRPAKPLANHESSHSSLRAFLLEGT
jgi:hypothetical protein